MFAVIILLAIMIFPTITSLSVVVSAVDRSLELGSIAWAHHRWKPISVVPLKSGIFAVWRSVWAEPLERRRWFLGRETACRTDLNPFDITRTLTSTILSGMHETTGSGL